MRQFNKIAIIGVGLIGGSIGLAIKRNRVAGKVMGIFRRRSTLRRALRFKAIDKGTMDLKEGVKGADLIIIATPVSSIPALFRELIKHAKRGAIVTDVGSTKSWIVDRIEKTPGLSSIFFVGSHPMAGSEHSGVEFAKEDLFKGSPCIVTRTKKTNKRALSKVINFWKALGTKVEVMSPARHDRSVSIISHLPHIVAFSLAGAVPKKELLYAAEGFKDTTRVASSDPLLWSDIFLTNREELLRSARIFERYFKKLTGALSKDSRLRLVRLLKGAKAKRDSLTGQVSA
ncbi:MAG: prephenate dehydrogenase/arogenate dehydrogenase family protein [Candidatus Omnitrophica bacterium]|nr:prephenate dehydrogenase/arogenate dehydrogenase family protein [Candidatus Omnitrophota bacterium]